MSGPLGFLGNNAHLALKANMCFRSEAPKFRFNKITSENQHANKKSEGLRLYQNAAKTCFVLFLVYT